MLDSKIRHPNADSMGSWGEEVQIIGMVSLWKTLLYGTVRKPGKC